MFQVSKIIPIFAAGLKIRVYMPEIFRFYGFSFFFYSREHKPIHVHVEGNYKKFGNEDENNKDLVRR